MSFYEEVFTGHSALEAGEYEQCTFTNCPLAGADLRGIRFLDCVFEDCDLSNANLHETALQTVRFERCKLVGLHFEDCRAFLFTVHFTGCNLELATFTDRKLPGTAFIDCRLPETDFTGADLQKADFSGSHLHRTIFERTDLRGADLRTATGYVIAPEENRLRGARFDRLGLEGLLSGYGIKID